MPRKLHHATDGGEKSKLEGGVLETIDKKEGSWGVGATREVGGTSERKKNSLRLTRDFCEVF